jgi:pimeloyl-ACP methyl ester carboxylesterase
MRTITAVLRSRAFCLLLFECLCAQPVPLTGAAESPQAATTEVTREDIFVPHASTVPANAGQTVGIFVRHVTRTKGGPTRGAVLFTNEAANSTLATLDLDYKSYSIAAALVEQGLDVYLMDHTGYGRSPRPTMDDPCNADPAQQQLLIPNPLPAPCSASYPRHLVTIFTELPEIDSVISYIRKQSGRNKISLAGWSRATFRMGLYAAQHPDKVERLAIVGPGYRPDAPSEFPTSTRYSPSADQSSRASVQRWSFFVRTSGETLAAWERQRRCEDIVDPGVYEALSKAIRTHNDPTAATWGTPPGAFYRVPVGSQVDAGWNRVSAKQVTVPTLLVVGEHDPRFVEEAPRLYADISSREKILVKVQCATHFLPFERNHQTVHKAFAEFLTKGTVNGRQGVVTVDRNGNYLP